jgi:hypothetical protein
VNCICVYKQHLTAARRRQVPPYKDSASSGIGAGRLPACAWILTAAAAAAAPVGGQIERCWIMTRSNKHIELAKRTEDGAVTYPTYQLGSNDRQMNTRSTAGSSKNKPTNEVSKGRVAGGGGGCFASSICWSVLYDRGT